MSTPADTARTIGTLGGYPVQVVTLDAADHPLRPLSPLHLNSSVFWVGWRGRWAEARNAVSARLERADPTADPEAVWRTLSHPPHDVPAYPKEDD